MPLLELAYEHPLLYVCFSSRTFVACGVIYFGDKWSPSDAFLGTFILCLWLCCFFLSASFFLLLL